MPRVTSALALALLLGACQTSAERCNAHPEDPACIPDAGTVGGLTYRSVQIDLDGERTTDVRLGLCGRFVREVVWLMPDRAPADGFVVQQVDIETTGACSVLPQEADDLELVDTCTDPPTVENLPPRCIEDGQPFIDRGGIRFWEVFPMEAGDIRYGSVDRWEQFVQIVARGETTIAGAARFYASADLGDEHPMRPDSPFQTDPLAVGQSGLPSTYVEPDFWRADRRPTLDRMMRVSWRCCPAMSTVVEEDTHDR